MSRLGHRDAAFYALLKGHRIRFLWHQWWYDRAERRARRQRGSR